MRPARNWLLRMYKQEGGPDPYRLWDLMAERATEKAIQRRERRAERKEERRWARSARQRRSAARRAAEMEAKRAEDVARQKRIGAIVTNIMAARPVIQIEPVVALPDLYRWKATVAMPSGAILALSGRITRIGSAPPYEQALAEMQKACRLHEMVAADITQTEGTGQ